MLLFIISASCFYLSILQLEPIPTGDSLLDLIVIGCGPAGLSLAAESAKRGLNVGLIGPDLPFTNNYGVWEDEFKGSRHSILDYWLSVAFIISGFACHTMMFRRLANYDLNFFDRKFRQIRMQL